MNNFVRWIFLLPMALLTAITFGIIDIYFYIREKIYELYNWTYDTDYYDYHNRLCRKLDKRNKK